MLSIQPLIAQATTGQTRLSVAYGLENYNFDAFLSQFSNETGIQVDISPFKNNDLKAELLQRSNIDQLPDAVIVPADFIGLSEIRYSEVPDALLSNKLTEKAKNSVKIAGRYLGVPIIAGNHLILFYNKALVQRPATSWQQLISQKNTLPENVRLITWSYHEMYWFIPFIGTFEEFPYLNGQLNFQTKGMKKALMWYSSLANDEIVDRNCDYTCSVEKFVNGEAAYTINGTWALNQFKNAFGNNLGVALLPKYEDKPMRPYFSSHVIAFPDHGLTGNKAEALKKLTTYFQRKDVQRDIWLQMRSLPTHQEVMNEIISIEKEKINALFKQLDYAEPMPIERDMAIVWEAMLKGVNRFHAGVFDVNKATEYMHYIADKSIKNDK